jgi:hypothetical protein
MYYYNEKKPTRLNYARRENRPLHLVALVTVPRRGTVAGDFRA